MMPNLVVFCSAEDEICNAARIFELSRAFTLASIQSGLETVEERLQIGRSQG